MDAPVAASGERNGITGSRLRAGIGINTVLGAGFVLTVGIWLFAGSYFSARVRDLETRAAAVNARYLATQELLSVTRTNIYQASIYVRDALLDPLPTMDAYRRAVNGAYDVADAQLTHYVPVFDTEADRDRAMAIRESIATLRESIADLRVDMLDVLAPAGPDWRLYAERALQTNMARRDAALRVAEELQLLNRAAYLSQQDETAQLYRTTHERFWQTLGLAVLPSMFIALFAALHVTGLERRLRAQQVKDARTAVDLQRLSARLLSAQEEERRTIARELHDEIGQVLTVIKMELAHAQREIAAGHSHPELLTDARAIADRAVQAVRDISQLLNPPLLEEKGLPAAVDWYAQSIRKGHEIELTVVHSGMHTRVPCDIELALYRIVQEGLTNVLRHSRAHSCHVSLIRGARSVGVTITDDGVGFSGKTNRGAGLGLIGIRERVAQLGGKLTITSAEGKGTTLQADFALESDEIPVLREAASARRPHRSETAVQSA